MIQEQHLSSYLPYELKGRTYGYNQEKKISILYGIVYDDFYETELIIETKLTNVTSRKKVSIEDFKPILYPLNLTKEIEQNEKKFVPIDVIKEKDADWSSIEGDKYILREDIRDGIWIGYTTFQRIPYWVIQKLLEWRFDVFNLIEQDLAIPITEDFNPYKQ